MGRTQLKEELQVSAKVNFRDDGYTPSPLVIASAIGCRTHTMRIGTNLMLLPFYHPVRVAKDVATLSLQRFRVRWNLWDAIPIFREFSVSEGDRYIQIVQWARRRRAAKFLAQDQELLRIDTCSTRPSRATRR